MTSTQARTMKTKSPAPTRTAEIVREYGPFPGVDAIHGVSHDGSRVWAATGARLLAFDPESGEVERTLERTPRLLERLFSPAEQTRSPRSLAARYAAKEALIKALGGSDGVHWTEIEITPEESGRPWFTLTGSTAAVIVVCILVGWLLGSTAWGFLVGAILGIPAGIYMTYQRYGHAL